jgi:ribokinase
MRVINFGSLNIDYVYRVDEFLLPGETKPALSRDIIPGGKGLNQSIALALAGVEVYHAGIIGNDGALLRDVLNKSGVRADYLSSRDDTGGHTVIQVNNAGQNMILLYGGTNRMFTKEYIDETMAHFGKGDMLLLQNEINLAPYIIERAHSLGLKTVFNAAPINAEVKTYPLELLDWLIVNEIEGAALAGTDKPQEILRVLSEKYKRAIIFLTLGPDGCLCKSKDGVSGVKAIPVAPVVDTTAAGDTFIGYLIQSYLKGSSLKDAMFCASVASSLSIQKLGAASSIPVRTGVDKSVKDWAPSLPDLIL